MKRLMIYTRQKSVNNKTFYDLLKNNSTLVLILSIFISAIIIGNIIIAANIIEPIGVYYNNGTEAFLWNIFYSLLILTITFCAGLCGVGMIYIYIIQFINGLVNGIISGSLIFAFGLNGMITYISVYLTSASLITIISIASAAISLETSSLIAGHIFLGNSYRINAKRYMLKYLYLLIIAIIASVISLISFSIFKK